MDLPAAAPALAFDTHPTRYRHWTLAVTGEEARLVLKVTPFGGASSELELKSNSYDLSVDVELHDALERLRFTYPEVKSVVVTSGLEKIFCAGANIYMLAASTHPFKVNFCKYTNETRLYLEEASAQAGISFLAACNGATAGGGYELALACDEIVLIDDGSSTVSLPEVPLLGVLPGTGGLTRVVDKRLVRRDLADAFSTLAEGVKGKRAVEWNLVDAVVPRSRFADTVGQRSKALVAKAKAVARGPGIELPPVQPAITGGVQADYAFVSVKVDEKARKGELLVRAPSGPQPTTAAEAQALGAQWYPIRMARELDDALVRIRFQHEEIGLFTVRTEGDRAAAFAAGELLGGPEQDAWIVREARQLWSRVLRRLDATGRSFYAVAGAESCFCGPLFELLVACDRSYVLDGAGVACRPGVLSGGMLPMWGGTSRLAQRFLADPKRTQAVLSAGREGPIDGEAMNELGLATVFADDLDFEEELRVATEERASLSPDALTGMEASFRAAGPETLATKIFGRLSAWQNWIFIRPNATGPQGALTVYGQPERPKFDWRRT